MSRSTAITARLPRPALRALAAVGFLVAFFSIASVIHPGDTPAAITPIPVPDITRDTARTLGDDALPAPGLLGTLESNDYVVQIVAASDEPRYTVYDLDGNLIAERVPADELYRIDPDLDPASMISSTPLMQVDPVNDIF